MILKGYDKDGKLLYVQWFCDYFGPFRLDDPWLTFNVARWEKVRDEEYFAKPSE